MSESMTVTASRGHPPWRMPRARLLVNGATRPETGLERFSLARTRYSRADTLDLTLALDRTQVPGTGLWFDLADPAAGSVLSEIDIELQMRDEAQSGAQWTTMFHGLVDHVAFSPAETSVHVQCRDYLARLLDMRVVDGWMNMTGAGVVRAMIAAAGLTPQVSMDDAMVGQFWQVEHKRVSAASHCRFQTAFDLASHLAVLSGCDLYADGTTIICAPRPAADATNTHHLDYTDTGPDSPVAMGASFLRFSRDYQIARGVIVHVTAWDSRQRTRVDYYWSAAGGSPANPGGTGTLHSFTAPGARLDDVKRIAWCKYNQIVAHARTVSGTIPGRIALQPRQFMQVSGTGTTWDGTLDIDAVESSFSWDGGFSQQLVLRLRDVTKDENSDD